MPSRSAAALSPPQPARRAARGYAGPVAALTTSAPALRPGFVRRPALVDDLVGAASTLALIVAPPGYGKSTLLADWAERDERPFAWIALARGAPRSVSVLTSRRPRVGRDGLCRLVRGLRERHKRFVVVLDDAHLVEPSALREAIEPALSELSNGSTLAVASRTEPSLSSGRLRAHRLLTEVRAQDLAMTSAEAAALLRQAGIEPDFEQVQSLVRRTEGWPAALYLAALALREDPEAVSGFGGDHHLVAEYLRDEVLAALAPDLLDFSVHSSVLEELSGPVCDKVLQRRGSAVLLARLARESPLLVPVDSAHHRYRWHRIMGEALRAELECGEPNRGPALRLRASGWYSQRGDVQRAIDQTAAAGEAAMTGELLWANILGYLASGRNDLVRGWLGDFSREQIADCAPLGLSAALSSLFSGDVNGAQRWALAAAASLERGSGGRDVPSFSTGLGFVDAISAQDGVERMAEVALSAAASEPRDSPWRPLCLLLRGVALHLQGDRAGAETVLGKAIRLSGNAAPSVTALSVAQLAMMAIEREEWDLAAELTDRATTMVEEWEVASDPLSAVVFAAAAASRAHQGRADEAKRDLRRGIDLLATLGDFAPWYEAEARILLAHASLWLADVVAARTLLAEASRFARRTPGAAIFSSWFDQAWAYIDTLAETSLAGPSSLTIAELRILRFLPSHRSFREIATHLGVSANTVKTQAHAVYRKLGAASRSEAVAQALEAGLLGQ